jgi:hypothetical protein
MSDHWDFYFCNVNDAFSSIFVDLGIRQDAPDPLRPHLLWIWVPMLAPRDDGLSSTEEAPTLSAIEDALSVALERECGAVLAGRITGAGRREFYFYGRDDGGFVDAVRMVFAAFTAYAPEVGDQPDAEWSQYLGLLYPSVRQLQQMSNRRVVQALASHNDVLTTPRPITHWIYFADVGDRDEVAATLAREGFRASWTEAPGPDEQPFGLCLERNDPAEQSSVDAVVFRILDTLEGRDATYDGWECPVVA